jgi:trehalose/maltose hydrolase-like predicted phosphorylase
MPEEFILPAGQQTFRKTYLMTIDNDDVIARENFDAVTSLSADDLLASHVTNWNDVWLNGAIDLETNDLVLQKVIAGSFYYLYSNLPSHNTHSRNAVFYGLSPGKNSDVLFGSAYSLTYR